MTSQPLGYWRVTSSSEYVSHSTEALAEGLNCTSASVSLRLAAGEGTVSCEAGSVVSGGADSVALLHVLHSLKEELEIGVFAAHFNHAIRGEEADRDEAFVKALCTEWSIPLYTQEADVPAFAKERGESLELCARNLRYRFLEKVARDIGGAKIATAHHSDDNAETVLWNLTRGSGLSGLAGIPIRRDNIIRPLLAVSRARIEAYCSENELSFVTDSTNLSDDCTRNKLRHQVMPVLRELNPSVGESVGRMSAIMREADEYLTQIAEKELKAAKVPYGWSCKKLIQCDPILLKYAVKNILEKAAAPVDFQHTALIIEAMRNGGAVDIGGGYTVSCAQGILRIVPQAFIANDFCVPLFDYMKEHGRRVTMRDGQLFEAVPPLALSSEKIHNLLLNDGIPCAIITRDTVLRRRRAGDTFTDRRRGVTKSLKKLMNELKIPREKRDTIPVVANGSTVLWIKGIGTSAQAKADLSRDGEYIMIEGIEHA